MPGEERKRKAKVDLGELSNIWTNGTIEDKLNTYGIANLKKLARKKDITGYETMEKADLVSILKDITILKDLPIR
jgi:hypothetical protein